MRSYDKVFYSLFKDKITELCLSSLICPFIIIWKENEVSISESSQVSFKNDVNSMKAILLKLAYP